MLASKTDLAAACRVVLAAWLYGRFILLPQDPRVESWRDNASQQVDDDFDRLFNEAMPWAERSRSRYRHMVPFGGSIAIDDSFEFNLAGEEGRSTGELLDLLHDSARHRKHLLRAVSFVVDTRLPEEGTDAILVHMEHVEGTAIEVVVPYRRNLLLRRVRTETNRAQSTEPIVWT